MDKQDRPNPEEDAIARLLRAAGPREQLPEDMKQRWEEQFVSELQPVLQRRGRGRRRWVMGLCASLALVVGALALTRLPPTAAPMEMRISYASGAIQVLPPGAVAHSGGAGQQLAEGSVIETGAEGLAGISYGGYDLRLNSNSRLVVRTDQLTLEVGALYASDYRPIASHTNGGATQSAQQLTVATAQVAVRDIGTQFTVTAYPQRTVTTVRRGAVLIDTGREELRAESLPGSAIRLTVDGALQIQREQVAPDGPEWSWIYRSSPVFNLEGKSVYDFLAWSVGESGLELEFATRGAETLARATLLHGDISGLDPEQAVQPVLASTDLVARRADGNKLRVTANR